MFKKRINLVYYMLNILVFFILRFPGEKGETTVLRLPSEEFKAVNENN